MAVGGAGPNRVVYHGSSSKRPSGATVCRTRANSFAISCVSSLGLLPARIFKVWTWPGLCSSPGWVRISTILRGSYSLARGSLSMSGGSPAKVCLRLCAAASCLARSRFRRRICSAIDIVGSFTGRLTVAGGSTNSCGDTVGRGSIGVVSSSGSGVLLPPTNPGSNCGKPIIPGIFFPR